MGESGDLIRFSERFFPGEDPQKLNDVWRSWDAEELVVLMEALPPDSRRQFMDELIELANCKCILQENLKIASMIKEKEETILRRKEEVARLEAELRAQEAQLKVGLQNKRRRLTGPPTQQSGPMAVLVPLAQYPILE